MARPSKDETHDDSSLHLRNTPPKRHLGLSAHISKEMLHAPATLFFLLASVANTTRSASTSYDTFLPEPAIGGSLAILHLDASSFANRHSEPFHIDTFTVSEVPAIPSRPLQTLPKYPATTMLYDGAFWYWSECFSYSSMVRLAYRLATTALQGTRSAAPSRAIGKACLDVESRTLYEMGTAA
ncbi:hypothetical protein BU16DRAFT_557431 [Lophium mytilinum]|uniref:Uncharacterized protein n=1 Tax=Lophium mytilinum TaxID=390894 RepID=A0A6A6R2U7_9PEZI|nr:hypothetical protein BU16DRAFT_557431 [Lophium mytilinum]